MKIRIIITGGTFDKHYDEIRGSLTFKDTHLPEILKFVRCTVPIELELNQLIDSLDMQTANRLQVLESCRRARRSASSSPTGPTRWWKPRKFSGKPGLPKTIVLTGAMVPYIFNNSDAVFNLGSRSDSRSACSSGGLCCHERPALPLGPREKEQGAGRVRGKNHLSPLRQKLN